MFVLIVKLKINDNSGGCTVSKTHNGYFKSFFNLSDNSSCTLSEMGKYLNVLFL